MTPLRYCLALSLIFMCGLFPLQMPAATAAPAAKSPLSDTELLAKAHVHVGNHDFPAAIVLYNIYLHRHPTNDEVRGRLAQALAWNKQYPAALRLYTDLLQRHPHDHDLRTAYGRIMAWTGRHQEAEASFFQVLHEDPNRTDTQEALGDLYRWSGREEEAARIYRILLRDSPNPSIQTKLDALHVPTNISPTHDLIGPQVPGPAQALPSINKPTVSAQSPRLPVGDPEEIKLPYRKFVTLGYAHSLYTRNVPDDHTLFLEGGIPIGNMTLVSRYEQIHRFRFDDPQFSTELYSPLWKGSWGVLHGSFGPGSRIIPRWSAGGTIYQSLASLHPLLSRLEPSMGYHHLHFVANPVSMLTPGLNIYLPANFWLTETLYLVPDTGAASLTSQLTWRPLPRVQAYILGGFGTTGERLTAAQDIQRINTTVYKAGLEFPIAKHWSAGLVGTIEDRETLYRRHEGRFYLTYIW